MLVAIVVGSALRAAAALPVHDAREAPSGFDNGTNGSLSQAQYDAAQIVFEKSESIAAGLGPLYNAPSCAACHATPITGGASQIIELRAGHLDALGQFVPPAGGSLIHDRAIAPAIQPHVADTETVRGYRLSPSLLGLGFVEAIDDATLIDLARTQAADTNGRVAGQAVDVPLLEAAGLSRVGRFGWKNQHASLLSFAAEAYVNELGITNRLVPHELGLNSSTLVAYDVVADPEDASDHVAGEQDIDLLAAFIRATKVPAPDTALAGTADARLGAVLFRSIGCARCHVTTLVTAPAGTLINGGTFAIPVALGGKVIHPYGDFLLHDIGTGDGIPQDAASGALVRTAPLWGLRARSRLMHDGLSLTPLDAIARHRGEALDAQRIVHGLSGTSLERLLTFLRSL